MACANQRRQGYDYRGFLEKRRKSGHYFACFRVDIKQLGLRAAAFLGYLCNICQTPGKSDEDGWVCMTENFVEEGTGLDPATQDKLFSFLSAKELVETENRGRRYVRVLVENLL